MYRFWQVNVAFWGHIRVHDSQASRYAKNYSVGSLQYAIFLTGEQSRLHPDSVLELGTPVALISVRYALNKSSAVTWRRRIHHQPPPRLVIAITIFRGVIARFSNYLIFTLTPEVTIVRERGLSHRDYDALMIKQLLIILIKYFR